MKKQTTSNHQKMNNPEEMKQIIHDLGQMNKMIPTNSKSSTSQPQDVKKLKM
jgi:hypothetical protein